MKYTWQWLLIFIGVQAFGQDTLLSLDGKMKVVQIEQKNDSMLLFKLQGKNKLKVEKLVNLYSIKYANGKEEIVYRQDTTLDFFLSQQEMKSYIYGFRDAKKNFKPTASNISSAVIGAVGPVLLPPFPWGVLASGLGVGVNSAIHPRINWETYTPAAYKNDEAYKTGFTDGAQKKKLFRGLTIAGISFAVSSVATTIILLQSNED